MSDDTAIEDGFTLVEVLVAFVVLSLGIGVVLQGLSMVSERSARTNALEETGDRALLAIVDAPPLRDEVDGAGTLSVKRTATGDAVLRVTVSVTGADGRQRSVHTMIPGTHDATR